MSERMASAEAEERELATSYEVLSLIRTFFVVSALSFHSVVEGLALALEDEVAGVWVNFGAMAMHKFVIAFSLGVELVSAKVGRMGASSWVYLAIYLTG